MLLLRNPISPPALTFVHISEPGANELELLTVDHSSSGSWQCVLCLTLRYCNWDIGKQLTFLTDCKTSSM